MTRQIAKSYITALPRPAPAPDPRGLAAGAVRAVESRS